MTQSLTRTFSMAACAVVCATAAFGSGDISATAPELQGGTVSVQRARVDLTQMRDSTTRAALEAVTPEMAQSIGPGSPLIIDIPNEGRFGCTANLVFDGGGTQYLGAAGHCFLPASATSTHGPNADFNASGVHVSVCVSDCSFGGESGSDLTGQLVPLGPVAFARQTGPEGDVGNDFGVVTIPSNLTTLVRTAVPVFGGPSSIEDVRQTQPVCIFGNGVGDSFLAPARVGVGDGSTPSIFMGDLAAAPGDSGSAVVTCNRNGTELRGRGAAGVLTHVGVEPGPFTIQSEDGPMEVQQGVAFGTTTERAIELAHEAGLTLTPVFP